MKERPGVRRWFRLRPSTRESVAEQVDEEIALHIELRVRELMARGMSETAARAAARERFGELDRARLLLQRAAAERERRMSAREWVAGWAQDVRYSLRALSRERLPALVIVLTLALGLGANTIMFGIVDHLLLRGPAHVAAPDQVRRVYATQEQWTGYGTSAAMGYITYALLRDNTSSFDAVAAYTTSESRLGRGETAREVPVGWSTADMFTLLGVRPHLGRFFTIAEDRPNDAANVAVIDHGFWQSEYGGATDVAGRTITIDDVDYTIIGVTPLGFTGPELKSVNIWLPLSTGFKPHAEWPTTWNARWLSVIARMRADVSPEQAAAAATAAYRAGAEGHSADAAEGVISLLPLRYGPRGEEPAEVSVTRWLLGVSLVVLLIAAANVMNLLLARVLRRRREVTVRLALGISRWRLARLLLSESLLLAFAGMAGALALTYWGSRIVQVALMPDVQWHTPLGGRVLVFAAVATLITGLVIGLAPVIQAGRHDLTRGLRTGAAVTGGRRARARKALTITQAAFSVVLLVGAGLFVRSLWNVSRIDLGIDADRVLVIWTTFAGLGDATEEERASERERRNEFFHQAVGRLRARPDVESVALALGTPLQGAFGVWLRVPGLDSVPELAGGGPYITVGTPGYFETVGTRIVRGRGFEEGEGAATEAIVVVSETMARALWPQEDALTKCVIILHEDENGPCARVVGIAEDAHRFGIRQEPVMQYYIPFGQEQSISGTQIVVRPRGDAIAFVAELRHVLHELDPRVSYLDITLLHEVIDRQIRPWRLGATMFLVFGAMALIIAAVGLYSVMAYGVVQRRAEIGVRMALGARTGGIIAMIVRQGIGLVAIGVIVGSALALAAGPLIEPLLFETSGRDMSVLVAVAGVLALVAVLASIIPAVRAGRADPLGALRAD